MNQYRRWTSLLLAVLLLSACALAAAGTAFSFRNGITWDTTAAQMMAAEGLTEDDGTYNREERNGVTFFYLKKKDVYYEFSGDQLVTAYVLTSGGDEAYSARREEQTALYGEPAAVSADTVSMLLNATLPNRASPADFQQLTAWRLDDGTLAALFTIGGRNYMAYFHN